MEHGARKGERGVALIVTITVITLLIATTMELNRLAWEDAEHTGAMRDRFKLSHMTQSGVHTAMAILLKDIEESGGVDSIQEEWSDRELISGALDEIGFDEGTLQVEIHDELSRIQVNALVEFPRGRDENDDQFQLWDRFLTYITAASGEDDESTSQSMDEDTTSSAITHSVKDWLDSGDDDAISGINGAESDYYLGLEPPYGCRNGPMTHADELLRVKGVAKFAELAGGWELFQPYITVEGMQGDTNTGKFTYPGLININTAELPVIAALLKPDDLHLAQEIVAYREEMTNGVFKNNLSKKDWYKKAPGCGNLIIDNLITVSSNFFRITASAELNKLRMTTVAVVQRVNTDGKNRCKVLSWQTE